MTRIAHISDLHILEDGHTLRSRSERLRLAYLSFGRPLDAEERRRRLARALAHVADAGADHLVITGDLTEDGTDAQLEVLADVLSEHGAHPDHVTIVPGNHDGYTDPGAWQRAIDGPLRDYARTSAASSVVVLDGAVLVAAHTMIGQRASSAAGELGGAQLQRIDHVARHFAGRRRAVVCVQHHGPVPRAIGPWQWLDGLRDHQAQRELLAKHAHLYVLHGHTHYAKDHALTSREPARVFSAAAVADSEAPVRLYEARDGELMPDYGCLSMRSITARATMGHAIVASQ